MTVKPRGLQSDIAWAQISTKLSKLTGVDLLDSAQSCMKDTVFDSTLSVGVLETGRLAKTRKPTRRITSLA